MDLPLPCGQIVDSAFPVKAEGNEFISHLFCALTRLHEEKPDFQDKSNQESTQLSLKAWKITLFALAVVKLGHSLYSRGSSHQKKKIQRVAVIGGGIAGAGAAFSLHRAGIDAVLFEKKPKLGGNAKSYTWQVGDEKVETGLAVLAYPEEFFHSYRSLMEEYNLEPTDHALKYFVAERNFRKTSAFGQAGGLEVVYAHSQKESEREPWLVNDLQRWDRLVAFVTRVNAFFSPSHYKSLYRMSMLNPLNLISLKRLCWLFGLSSYFWERVFVPVHTSTFLEVEMGDVPSVMAELLNDMVPLSGKKLPNMKAWPTTAYEVFEKMAKSWPATAVRTNCGVERLAFSDKGVLVYHEDTAEGDLGEEFDAVIFACSAPSAQRILTQSTGGESHNRALVWLENFLLRNILYTVDRDRTFEQGVVHSNAEKVFPAKFRDDLLNEHCNYMEVDGKSPGTMENHFIISSWAPTANVPSVKGKKPMLVSYNCEEKLRDVEAEWTVTSREAHPCLTIWQAGTVIALWPLLQGFRNKQVYYCGSAFTPGNGHDLSLLSGFVVASELGAPYPFPENAEGSEDFLRLRKMMLSLWA